MASVTSHRAVRRTRRAATQSL